MQVLVTGATGLISYQLCEALLRRGGAVVGFGNLNDSYEVSLKEARLVRLRVLDNDSAFMRRSLKDESGLRNSVTTRNKPIGGVLERDAFQGVADGFVQRL